MSHDLFLDDYGVPGAGQGDVPFVPDNRSGGSTMCYCVLPPVCRYHGKRQTLAKVQENTYADESVRAELIIDTLQPGRDRLVCRWTNLSDQTLSIQPEIRV